MCIWICECVCMVGGGGLNTGTDIQIELVGTTVLPRYRADNRLSRKHTLRRIKVVKTCSM